MINKFLILLLIGTLWACENNAPAKKNPMLLKLALETDGYLGVGYGEVYPCNVLDVLEGDFTSDSLLLTILAGDTLSRQIMAFSKQKLVITFKKHKKNEPYQIMPISGMVDAEKTSWLITAIEAEKK